jgi:hypothetical protein
VQDIDGLRTDYNEVKCKNGYEWTDDGLQAHIDEFIAKQKKPLVFIGLSVLPWITTGPKVYYDMHSENNFYIDIDDMEVVKQRCLQFLVEDLPYIMSGDDASIGITDYNEDTVKTLSLMIEKKFGKEETLRMNKMWSKDYKKWVTNLCHGTRY